MDSDSSLNLADVTIGVLTALDVETAAAKAIFESDGSPKRGPDRDSPLSYYLARIDSADGGHHTVAIAQLSTMGNNMAATAATHMFRDFGNLRVAIMCGIAGAIPNVGKPDDHVRLGDVIVSDFSGVIQYDFGKQKSDEFEVTSTPHRLTPELSQAAQRLRLADIEENRRWERYLSDFLDTQPDKWCRPDKDVLLKTETDEVETHPDQMNRRPGFPVIHYGTIASAGAVQKNPALRDKLGRAFNALAVEMEGSGIADAAWSVDRAYLVVRSACDYCDHRNKDKRWHFYAAAVAAAYTRAFVEELFTDSTPGIARPPAAKRGTSDGALEIASDSLRIPDPVSDLVPIVPARSGEMQGTANRFLKIERGSTLSEFPSAPSGAVAADQLLQAALGIARDAQVQSAENVAEVVDSLVESAARSLKTLEYDAAQASCDRLRTILDSQGHLVTSAAARGAWAVVVRSEVNFQQQRLASGIAPSCDVAKRYLQNLRAASTVESHEDESRVAAFEAALAALEGDSESALLSLSSWSSGAAFAERVRQLCVAGRHTEVLNLIRDQEPDDRWLPSALKSMVAADRLSETRALLRVAASREDRLTAARCAISTSAAAIESIFESHGRATDLSPAMLSDGDKERVSLSVAALGPVAIPILASSRAQNKLEIEIVQNFLIFSYLNGDRDSASDAAQTLFKETPVSLKLADAMLRGFAPAPGELPRRLREEHPFSFEAKKLAAAIQSDVLDEPNGAFSHAQDLVAIANSDEEQTELCRLLNQIAQKLDSAALEEVDRITERLPRTESHFRLILAADRDIRAGRVDSAIATLESAELDRNDPEWLQLRSLAHYHAEEFDEAADKMSQAADLLQHKSLFLRASDFALRANDSELAIRLLRQLRLMDPTSPRPLERLASVLAQNGSFDEAADAFRQLMQLEPTQDSHELNRADCLVLADRLEEALEAYEPSCSRGMTSWVPLAKRAQLLVQLDRPRDAFESVQVHQESFAQDAEFLMFLAELGYATDHDDEAANALARVRELQSRGEAAQHLIVERSLDELVEDMKVRSSMRDSLLEHVMQGRLPWQTADAAAGERSAYRAWHYRTQPVRWLGPSVSARTSLTVYATHGFARVRGADRPPRLQPISSLPFGSSIVIDLTAMVSLHELGLLELVQDQFGVIHFPSSYLAEVTNQRARLRPHQPSQSSAAEQLIELVVAGRIVVLSNDEDDVLHIDEYSGDDEESSAGLSCLIDAIRTTGLFTTEQTSRLVALANRTPESLTRTVSSGTPISVAGSTLMSLASAGLVDSVARDFQVRIRSDDLDELNEMASATRKLHALRSSHDRMWETIRSGGSFRPHGDFDAGTDTRPGVELDALSLATRLALPLLADDRACQVALLNERSDGAGALGTNLVIEMLLDSELIDLERAIEAFLQLIRWRYRFITIPSKVLVGMIKRYPDGHPGRDLIEVARYVHGSMSDPGLLSGPENTEPPSSMADALYRSWISRIVEFLVDAWADIEVSPEATKSIFEWAAKELIPSPPSSALSSLVVRDGFSNRAIVSLALFRASGFENVESAHDAVFYLGSCLGLTKDQIRHLAAEYVYDL